jgi:hypothetical protein
MDFLNMMDMHIEGYAYQISNSCCLKQIVKVQLGLSKRKQHDLEFKSWSLKTRHKQHQTRRLESLSLGVGETQTKHN